MSGCGEPHGDLELGGRYAVVPRGALTVAGPRALTVVPSLLGAYGPDGELASRTVRTPDKEVFKALLRSESTPRRLPAPVIAESDEEVVWAGDVSESDGGFLIHSVSRLWPLLPGGALEGKRVVFTSSELSPLMRDWVQAYGVDLVELPAGGATRFNRMLVPEPAWRYWSWIAPEIRDVHLHARSRLRVAQKRSLGVLWLGRTDAEARPFDEALLEWILGDHVQVVRPHAMRLAEQVRVFEAATAVAGVIDDAFHVLLMLEEVPDCLYLCPPRDRGRFPAQHRFLDCVAKFTRALSVAAWTPDARDNGIIFPHGHRLSIPKTLNAMNDTVYPGLLDDPRMALFADPAAARVAGSNANELDRAVLAVIRDPHSVEPRRRLGIAFESCSLNRLAGEQRAACAALGLASGTRGM